MNGTVLGPTIALNINVMFGLERLAPFTSQIRSLIGIVLFPPRGSSPASEWTGRGTEQQPPAHLHRFAAPRDPALIAKWISYTVINTERQDWRRGAEAAFRYRLLRPRRHRLQGAVQHDPPLHHLAEQARLREVVDRANVV
ncbi:hypothetical protein [Streptomyces sp. NPDC059874]|uniref:hypothetical protein n=1 Tax=Streptomyces sp. NPDC059874 TaxID=3346983 RepID=UPI00365912E0